MDTFPTTRFRGFWPEGVLVNNHYWTNFGLLSIKHALKKVACEVSCMRFINQDFSYYESLSGQPGAWRVKKIFFYMQAITKLRKYLILKFKITSRTSFVFMIAFMVYE